MCVPRLGPSGFNGIFEAWTERLDVQPLLPITGILMCNKLACLQLRKSSLTNRLSKYFDGKVDPKGQCSCAKGRTYEAFELVALPPKTAQWVALMPHYPQQERH